MGLSLSGTTLFSKGMLLRSSSLLFTLPSTSSHLLNTYRPCSGEARDNFVAWMLELDILDDELWMLAADFNFYRSDDNRNKPRGNPQDMRTFNNTINLLGLVEIPILGRAFT